MLASLRHDLRYALRTLALNPGFAAVSILALALGIGANSAIFTVVNSVLLEPLRFDHPEQLVIIRERNLEAGFPQFSLSPGNYQTYRDENRSFSGAAAWNGGSVNLSGLGEPERLRGSAVTTNFFSVMHAQPVLGRAFTPEEGELGSETKVILSYGFWQRQFAGERSVLGRKVMLNAQPYEIVGVMPKDFTFPSRTEVWRPLAMNTANWRQRGGHYLGGIGRLKAGATVASAQSDLNNIAQRLQRAYPDSNHGWDTTLSDLQESTVGRVRPAMMTLLAAVGFVLLIACVNLANLLLSRSAARRREIGVRGALGASKGRLMQQLLTESLALSAIGASLGLALAWLGTRLLGNVNPSILPRAAEISLDGRVLLFTTAVAILTGLLFGLAPALQMARSDLNSALREGGRGNSVGFRRNQLRSILVAGEVALAVVLLSGSVLLMRSFYLLQGVDPGFNSSNVLTFRTNLPRAQYPKDEQQNAFYERALTRIRNLPGVISAGAASIFPLAGDDYILTFERVGKPPKPRGQEDSCMYYVATPGYFESLRIPLKSGRYLNASDSANTKRVAIISESMAHRFFPGENPLGQRIFFGDKSKPSEIVGVVGDVRDEQLESKGRVAVYEAESQNTFNGMYFAVRAAGDPASLISAVRKAIHSEDAQLPLDAVGTVDALVEASLSQRRFAMLLMAVFAALALALAIVGIYGVLSYAVNQATQEIGIRMALGAGGGDVLRLVLRYGGLLIGVGLFVGIAAAMATGRLLASQLFDVRATDPVTYLTVTFALAATGAAACLIPALRAVRVDPLIALRNE